MTVDVSVVPELAAIVTLGILTIDGASVREGDAALGAALEKAAQQIRAGTEPPGGGGTPPSMDVVPSRNMYKRFGIDPTKTRPSSEALLRRVRKGNPLPRINSLVDISNWCSVELQWCYGLYDLSKVAPPVELRRGRAGEEYPGIRKDAVHLEGRPALVDASGPFGNPTSDAARTMVTPATTTAMYVIFAPAGTPRDRVDRALSVTAARAAEFTGARETGRAII
jgi:DNA/RNA-binding domain of Phe-tRNA-synthetase-like protein